MFNAYMGPLCVCVCVCVCVCTRAIEKGMCLSACMSVYIALCQAPGYTYVRISWHGLKNMGLLILLVLTSIQERRTE